VEDWLKIKTEYITTDTSYRKLAEKYGMRYATIQARGQQEGWRELKDQFRIKTVSKTIEKTSEKKAKQAAKVGDLAGRLLIKLEKAIEEVDQTLVTHKVKTRDIEYGDHMARGKPTHEVIHEEEKILAMGSVVDRAGLNQLAAALQRLQVVTGQVSDLERREREARIEALRRSNSLGDEDDDETGVVLLPPRREVDSDG
jgi:hypothetical protein